MATADDVLAHISVAFASIEENQKQVDAASSGIEGTVTHIDQVRSTAEELASQSETMGYLDKVAAIHTAINKSNEAQAQFNAAKQSLDGVLNALNGASTTLQEAQAQIQSLKG